MSLKTTKATIKIFTDGWKQGIYVAAAAVSHDKVLVKRLRITMHPFSQPKQ
jgi:hypothetical protein